MNVVLITPNFTIAGVPLAQLRFAESLAKLKFDVTLIIGNIGDGYSLPDVKNVNVIILNKNSVTNMFIPLCSYLRKNNPDIIFSAEDHLNAVVLLAAIITNTKSKISCSSRVTPYDTYSDKLLCKKWILKQFTKLVSWRASVLTCVSTGMIEEYEKVFRKKTRHQCVFNIIDYEDLNLKVSEKLQSSWFNDDNCIKLVAAGRLAHWKAYDDLINAIKIVTKRHKIKLYILGDGPQKEYLQELIDALELNESVKLSGYVTNPLKYFKEADIFVHTAKVESLGNVLVEAMICGCTVVSTDCPTGPREILQYGKFGYLSPINDPEKFADNIDKAIVNPISQTLLKEAIAPFSKINVIKKHFELLGIDLPNSLKG